MFENKQQRLYFQDISSSIKHTFAEFPRFDPGLIPACKILNAGFSYKNLNEKELRFINQNESLPYPEMGYEERIYEHGMIATRKNNWHDFFNAMVWHRFPNIKIAINAAHYHEVQKQNSSLRSRKRDLLTLFDECGVIIFANPSVHELIRQHQWKELFIGNKEQWLSGNITMITFGHAMYEKYMQPYIGMTAQALLLPNTFKSDYDNQIGKLIANGKMLLCKSELSPLPVLGIPQWHKNQDDEFYANENYFR